MKYVISDQNEIQIGNDYHFNLSAGFKGKVIAAGHCDIVDNKITKVYGESFHYKVDAQPEDLKTLQEYFEASSASTLPNLLI